MLMTGQEVEAPALMAMGATRSLPSSRPAAAIRRRTAETVAGKLSLDAQADLLAAILR